MNSYKDCREIVELDLDPIKVKLMHKESGEGWTLEQANVVEAEYRRYLYLMKAFPNEAFAPGREVDTFWHYHILDTIKYAADCKEVFGYFVHHFPYIGLRGEEDMAAHQRLGERMRTIYEAAFGETYRTGKLVPSQAPGGAFAAKPGGTAFSASPVGTGATDNSGIAFSASPVGGRTAEISDTAFSASPVGTRTATSSEIAFSASPVGSRATASSGTAFSASPVGTRAASNNGTAFSASPVGTRAAAGGDLAFPGGPVYMTRFGPGASEDADAAGAGSSARLGNTDEVGVASDDLFSIRPRLPEPIAA